MPRDRSRPRRGQASGEEKAAAKKANAQATADVQAAADAQVAGTAVAGTAAADEEEEVGRECQSILSWAVGWVSGAVVWAHTNCALDVYINNVSYASSRSNFQESIPSALFRIPTVT